MGTGGKVFKQTSVLQAMLLENSQDEDHTMWMLETNLDDCVGKMLGLTMKMLLDTGAADVWYTSIHMKKNRLAYAMPVLCRKSSIGAMEKIVLAQTTTIEIRRYPTERIVLGRSEIQVETNCGPVDVKMYAYKGRKLFYLGYESIRRVCMEQGADSQTAYYQIHREIEKSRQG